jgi:hypothetical protein
MPIIIQQWQNFFLVAYGDIPIRQHLACYEIPRRGKLSVRCLGHILNLIVKEFLSINNFYIPTVGIISTDISMGSMDFTNMNMNTGFFSWIISVDISVLLKIYGYESNFHGYYPWGALVKETCNQDLSLSIHAKKNPFNACNLYEEHLMAWSGEWYNIEGRSQSTPLPRLPSFLCFFLDATWMRPRKLTIRILLFPSIHK